MEPGRWIDSRFPGDAGRGRAGFRLGNFRKPSGSDRYLRLEDKSRRSQPILVRRRMAPPRNTPGAYRYQTVGTDHGDFPASLVALRSWACFPRTAWAVRD